MQLSENIKRPESQKKIAFSQTKNYIDINDERKNESTMKQR